jgi:hypothetical protein
MSRPTQTPAADFGALRLKLARARTRLDELRKDVSQYLATNPVRIENVTSGTTFSLRSIVENQPDPEWGIDLSEVAVAIRSVLDQMVWQLVLQNGRDPSTMRTQFPIATSHGAYTKGRRPTRERMLEGVARKHRRIIDEYQPYQAGQSATKHPLYVLNEMVNSEKHRAGHVVLGTASACRAKLINPAGEEVILSFKRAMTLGHNVDFFKVNNQPDLRFPDQLMRMELIDFKIDVGFQDGETVALLSDLERALLMVSQIVARCESRL